MPRIVLFRRICFCPRAFVYPASFSFLIHISPDVPQARRRLCYSMETFPFDRRYDLIWVQWVIIYLPDEAFIRFELHS